MLRRIWKVIKLLPEIIVYLEDVNRYFRDYTRSQRAKALEARGRNLLSQLRG